ncbi:MAG: hypothetical protein WBM17_12860 [Anaerolineales bacterium]
MPSDFPRSPILLKGALVVYDSQTPGTRPRATIPFQYNPEQLSRSLANRAAPREASNVGAAREDAMRVIGPPVETINLNITLDATDPLEDPDRNRAVAEHGLHPVLATLELLLYPATAMVDQIDRLAAQGEVQLSPADLPLVLLTWGESRVVPVMLTSFSVTEQAFDPKLNPIRAEVRLGMRVLTYMEFPKKSVARDAFLAYQRKKEELAKQH